MTALIEPRQTAPQQIVPRQTAAVRQPEPIPAGGQPPRLHFPAVDGLRGAAVLSVLLYHTSWFSNGLFGVDVFMVLSGFLITLLLYREVAKTGRISLLAFYRRRFKRLMPGLSIVLFATLVLSYLLGGVEEARQTGAKAIAALFQYANWQQISNNDAYWQGFGRVTPLAHMWSLSITEQFYVVWPMLWVALFWVCRRSVAAVTGIMFLLLAGTATIAPLLYDGSNSDRLYLGTETRTVDFIAGAAAAGVVFLLHQHSARRRHARAAGRWSIALSVAVGTVALIALVVVSVLTSSYQEPWLYKGGMAAVAVVTAVLIASLCHDRGPLVRAFSFGPLTEIGRISYTMYLLHLPIFWVMQKLLPTVAPYGLFVVGGGLTWLGAMTMHYAVTERIRLRPWRPLRAVPTAIVTAAAIVAGSYFLPTVVAQKFSPDGRPTVLLLGDSLSRDFAAALAADRKGEFTSVDGAISGCGVMAAEAVRPVSGVIWPESKQCKLRNQLWQDSLRQTRYRAILLHFGWDAADQKIGGRWLSPCDPEYRTRYLSQLDLAVQQIQAEAPGVPLLLMNERTGSWGATPAAIACYNQIVESFTRSGKAHLFDFNTMVCPPQAECLKTDSHGRNLFLDGVHFTPAGQEFIGPLLEQGIAASLAQIN
jgi:peptidoglycan/LPS O-acetylase OafA/YrhL